MWVYEMWEILMIDCEVYEWSMWTWYWLKVREILNVKCEICHVVMEGKGYLQLGGKDICDLLEETLVVNFGKY